MKHITTMDTTEKLDKLAREELFIIGAIWTVAGISFFVALWAYLT